MSSNNPDPAKSARLWSWAVNWTQLFIKLAVAILSNSKAVYAALAGEL